MDTSIVQVIEPLCGFFLIYFYFNKNWKVQNFQIEIEEKIIKSSFEELRLLYILCEILGATPARMTIILLSFYFQKWSVVQKYNSPINSQCSCFDERLIGIIKMFCKTVYGFIKFIHLN